MEAFFTIVWGLFLVQYGGIFYYRMGAFFVIVWGVFIIGWGRFSLKPPGSPFIPFCALLKRFDVDVFCCMTERGSIKGDSPRKRQHTQGQVPEYI